MFRNVGIQNSDAGELPRRKHATNIYFRLRLTTLKPLVPKFAGSNPAEAVGFFQGEKKILSAPFFGEEVKPSVPCPTWHVKDP